MRAKEDDSDPIRLLHLSDFHFAAGKAWDADPVLRSLARYVGEEVTGGLTPDWVVVTGDLAYSGRAEEYAMATEWLTNQLWPRLPAGLPADRLLLVPGNHDVDRSKVSGGARSIQNDMLAAGSQEAIAALLRSDEDRNLLFRRHSAYSEFLAGWCGRPQPLPWWQRSLDVRGTRLHVAGLDSAFMAHDDQDRGRLLLGRYQIHQTVLSPHAEGADWRLALLHHPWDYLAEFDSHEARSSLHQHCDAVLRGHLHSPQTERIVRPGAHKACLELAAGCIYENSRYPNAFQWIELHPAPKRVKVMFRAWLHGEWTVDRNQPGCPKGECEFLLETPAGTGTHVAETKNPLPAGEGRVRAKTPVVSMGSAQAQIAPAFTPTGSAPLASLPPEGGLDSTPVRLAVPTPTHIAKAIRRLDVPGALPFRDLLRRRIVEKQLADESRIGSTAALVEFVAHCADGQVQTILWAIRWAFGESEKSGALAVRESVEAASVALYCLAAAQAVVQLERRSGYVFKVRDAEPLLCGVIALVLEGKELRLESSMENRGTPCPTHIYSVSVPAAGTEQAKAFLRAAHRAVVPNAGNRRDAGAKSLDDAPLTSEERADLETELDDIAQVQDCCRALVVHGLFSDEACREFADILRVPTMLPDGEAPDCFGGLTAKRLLSEINKFWQLIDGPSQPELPAPADPPSSAVHVNIAVAAGSGSDARAGGAVADHPQPTHQEHTPMTKPDGNVFNINAQTVAVTTGNRSPAMAGDGQAANVAYEEGAGLADLEALGRELLEAIQALQTDSHKAALAPLADAVAKEAAKGLEADGKKIMDSLKTIEATGKAFDAGAKIFELCNKGYKILAPLLGLPPSPL